MDTASFIASIADPQLRAEILATAEPSVLALLPPSVRAEAQLIRERAASRMYPRYGYRGGRSSQDEAGEGAERGGDQSQSSSSANAASSSPHVPPGSMELDDDLTSVDTALTLPPPILDRVGIFSQLRLFYFDDVYVNSQMHNAILTNLCKHPNTREVILREMVSLLTPRAEAVSRKPWPWSWKWPLLVSYTGSPAGKPHASSARIPPQHVCRRVLEALQILCLSPRIVLHILEEDRIFESLVELLTHRSMNAMAICSISSFQSYLSS